MSGALVIALILLVVIPVSIILTGALVAAILGWSLKEDAEQRNEGSELIDLNV
jgi:nitrogen fixation-related uncharacterized protein